MSTEKIRCGVCRGQKKMNGIGGVTRDCWGCGATGFVDKPVAAVEAHKVEIVPITEVFKEMGVPDSVVAEMAAIATSEVITAIDNKKKEVEVVIGAKAIFEGYSDALMEALFDEPKMPLVDWKKKHMRNNELFILGKDSRGTDVIGSELIDLHMRNTIRLMYAQSKPTAPRKVNMAAQQDISASKDPDYVKYDREMKAKAEAEARKAQA